MCYTYAVGLLKMIVSYQILVVHCESLTWMFHR